MALSGLRMATEKVMGRLLSYMPVREVIPSDYRFPLNEDWDFEQIVYLKDTLILAKDTKKLLEEVESGWLVEGEMRVNDPDVIITVKWQTGSKMNILQTTPREIVEDDNDIQPVNMGFWCSRYDQANNVYRVRMECNPWIPYHRYVYASLYNPTNSSIILHTFTLFRVILGEKLAQVPTLEELR